jgi:hypothetical protein
MELASLADVKAFLKIENSDTQFDAILTIFKNSVEAAILNFTDCPFEAITVTGELYDGTDCDIITPKNYPLISVEGLYFYCDGFGQNGTKIDPEYYVMEESGIVLRNALFAPNARKNIRIDYTYGYEDVPADVKICVLQGVKAEFQRWSQNTENINSRSKMGESESFGSAWDKSSGLPSQILGKLQPYKVYEFPMIGNAQRNR